MVELFAVFVGGGVGALIRYLLSDALNQCHLRTYWEFLLGPGYQLEIFVTWYIGGFVLLYLLHSNSL